MKRTATLIILIVLTISCFNNSNASLPGRHGAYIGEVTTETIKSKIPSLTVLMIEEFLNNPLPGKN